MNIEFVEYTGEWPALCMGKLTLKIDGKKTTFGMDGRHRQFWMTGGSCTFDEDYIEIVSQGPWRLDSEALPKKLREHGQELIDLFNEHVPMGCCGGCV